MVPSPNRESDVHCNMLKGALKLQAQLHEDTIVMIMVLVF